MHMQTATAASEPVQRALAMVLLEALVDIVGPQLRPLWPMLLGLPQQLLCDPSALVVRHALQAIELLAPPSAVAREGATLFQSVLLPPLLEAV